MNAAFLAIVLAACGGSQPPPAPVSNVAPIAPVDAAVDVAPARSAGLIAKMAQFSDGMCACADRPCVERITQEMTTWGQEMAASYDEHTDRPNQPSEAEMKQMTAIAQRMTKCMMDVMTRAAGSGSTP